MGLLLNHPELPACADCQAWLYSEQWERTTRCGEPVPRPASVPPPCYRCPKIPKGVEPRPANAVVLSARNMHAWRYSLQCQVDTRGVLAQDRITVRNNALIRWVEEQARKVEMYKALPLLALAGKRGK